ncbi:2-deoxy-D-gluconate 3-dehydrogenase [Rhizobium sp. CF080]|nr:2-deoxy-D-gluconate 3-dehydrogenase [Rhizobium sp. CF080]
MSFTDGSWHFDYVLSDAELGEGIDLVVQYHFERRQKLMGLLGFYDALAKRFRKTAPSPLIVSEKREIRSIKAEFGPDIVRAQGDGLLIELDTKRLRKLITLGNWLVLFYDGGHLLLPRRIFPNDTTAERYISYVRGLIRRRRQRATHPTLLPRFRHQPVTWKKFSASTEGLATISICAISAFSSSEEDNMAVSFDLTGKTAIVTGANTGLGQAISVALAQAGADVALVGRSSMAETEAAVGAAGGRSLSIQADLSTLEPVDRIISETVAWTGRADILVNNAGIIRRADAIDFTEADWDAVMDVNLKTVFFLSQAFARRLITEGKGGKIVNIASLLSFQGGIRIPSYTASKSGLAGLTRLLACEWAGKGINVNAIAPGYFSTNNTEALRNDPDRNAAILGRIPAGHWGQPEELGGAAVFLASPASDYIHGIVLPVDGGWLAR